MLNSAAFSSPSLGQAPLLTHDAAMIKRPGDLEPPQKEELFVQREEPGGTQPARRLRKSCSPYTPLTSGLLGAAASLTTLSHPQGLEMGREVPELSGHQLLLLIHLGALWSASISAALEGSLEVPQAQKEEQPSLAGGAS